MVHIFSAPPPRVFICILNHNGYHLLKVYLPQLLMHSASYEVVVIDNGSADQSIAYLRHCFPEIRLMLHNTNLGFAEGYNAALSQVKADYFVLLNNDVQVTPGWLDPMVSLMENNPNIAFCQPKICSLSQPGYFEHAGAAGGFIDKYGYPFCRGRIFDHLEADQGQYDDTVPVFWASGACLLVRADAFFDVGGFDGAFFAHFDEIDLCVRAQNRGWQVYYCGASKVYHLGGSTLAYQSPEKTYLNFRNRGWMYYKYNTFSSWLVTLVFDLLAACYMCCYGKFNHGFAILRAIVDGIRFKTKDRSFAGTMAQLPYVYQRSIIIDFFIKKKRIFHELALKQIRKI